MEWKKFELLFGELFTGKEINIEIEVLSDFEDDDIFELSEDVSIELDKKTNFNIILKNITGDFNSEKHREKVLEKIMNMLNKNNNIFIHREEIEEIIKILIEQEFWREEDLNL